MEVWRRSSEHYKKEYVGLILIRFAGMLNPGNWHAYSQHAVAPQSPNGSETTHTSGVLHLWGQLCHVLDKLLNLAVKFTGGKHPSDQVPVKCFLSCQLPVQEEELIRLQRGR